MQNILFSILTLGCKVNTYESDAIRKGFETLNAKEVPFGETADIIVINTCAVTQIADKKSRQMLHRAKRKNPDAVVVATGCHAQEEKDEIIKSGTADLVIGNNLKTKIPELAVEEYLSRKKLLEEADSVSDFAINTDKSTFIEDLSLKTDFESMEIDRPAEHTRAFIKIQDGCNQFCSYCIIPYLRGRIRSREPEDVIKEVKALAEKGCKEIVINGIHLSSYGNENAEPGKTLNGMKLASLICELDKIDGIERIRLGSLEPRVVTPEFTEKIASAKKLCPHFHLSLQSGCDATLKRMNRKYTAEEYAAACELLRKTFDRPALTTDVIVGFPGETDEEFEACRAFVEKIAFSKMHIFRYSRRKGTVADKMKDQVKDEVKVKRSEILLELDKKLGEEYRRSFDEEEVAVLTEDLQEIDGVTYRTGYSERYIKYLLAGDTPENAIVNVISSPQNTLSEV